VLFNQSTAKHGTFFIQGNIHFMSTGNLCAKKTRIETTFLAEKSEKSANHLKS
jgi:hypothetical protein